MNNFQSDDNKMHPDDRRNFIIFAIASILVYIAFSHFFLDPQAEKMRAAKIAASQRPTLASALGEDAIRPREAVIADAQRLPVRNEEIYGTIPLTGGRLDDMRLQKYFKTIEKRDNVTLLSPAGAEYAKYVEFGWLPGDGITAAGLPGKNTQWRVAPGGADELTPDTPVTLQWTNAQGLRFERHYQIDHDSMITVEQRVVNGGGANVTLYPYALIAQRGMPEEYYGAAMVHEGPIGYIGGELVEHSYKKMSKEPKDEFQAFSGWIGITEKFWLTSLIPVQEEQTKFRFLYTPGKYADQPPLYQTDIVGAARTIAPGETATSQQRIFTGAKEIDSLSYYEKELGVHHFDLAVDFGLWYFLTKPIFHLLDFLAGHVGNFGIAIIILTVIVRLAVFPLANTSFRSFAKMKKIAPQMKELREKYGDNKEMLQKELVGLYEKEKVNPMAGCLPILIQIPIFFALFKVFSVTIEMRHAPFFGWIQDLSERDPTSVFNLFGLIPWTPPEFLMIGAWPCMMLFFMIIQRKMNPPPQDKAQAFMLKAMPFVITFILSKFAAGLVIYWTFSNALSVLQQYIIMRSMGVEVHLFKRSKAEEELEEQVEKGPAVHPELEMVEDDVEEALFGDEDEQRAAQKPITPPKKKKKKKK